MPRKYEVNVNVEYTQLEDDTWNATAKHRSRAISVFEYSEKRDARKALKQMAKKLNWILREE
jgi:hypothetical protein